MAETIRIELANTTEYSLSSVVNGMKEIVKSSEKAGKAVDKAGKYISKFDIRAEKAYSKLAEWTRQKYEIILEAKDRISPVFFNLNYNLSDILEQINRISELISKKLGKISSRQVMISFDFNVSKAGEKGIQMGKAFSDGFSAGFEGKKMTFAIQNALSEGIQIVIPPVQTGGGEEGSGTGDTLEHAGLAIDLISLFNDLFKPSEGSGNLSYPAKVMDPTPGLQKLSLIVSALYAARGIGSGLENLGKSRQHKYDAGARAKESRTGMTKLSMVAAGGAIGTAVLPGAGTVIGAGIGGIAALSEGDAVSDWVGGLINAKDKQYEILAEMGQNLSDALVNYNQIVSDNASVEGLISEYKQLDAAIQDGGLSTGQMESAQKRMNEISGILQGIFPALISNYDSLNGKTGERIKLVEKEMEMTEKQAVMDLRQSTQKMDDTLPETQENLMRDTKERDKAYMDWEKNLKYQQELNKLLDEFEKASEDFTMEYDDIESLKLDIVENATNLSEEMGFNDKFEGIDHMYMRQHAARKDADDAYNDYQSLNEKVPVQKQAMKEHYQSKLALIAIDGGINMDALQSAIGQIETLKKAQVELATGNILSDDSETKVNEIFSSLKLSKKGKKVSLEEINGAVAQLQSSYSEPLAEIDELNKSLYSLPDENKIYTGASYGISEPLKKKPYENDMLLEKQASLAKTKSQRDAVYEKWTNKKTYIQYVNKYLNQFNEESDKITSDNKESGEDKLDKLYKLEEDLLAKINYAKKNTGQGRPFKSMYSAAKHIEKDMKESNNLGVDYDTLSKEAKDKENDLGEEYNSEITKIAYDNGMSVGDMKLILKKIELMKEVKAKLGNKTLDKEGKEKVAELEELIPGFKVNKEDTISGVDEIQSMISALETSIAKPIQDISNLNKLFDELPENKRISVDISYNVPLPQGIPFVNYFYKLLQPQLKKPENLVSGGSTPEGITTGGGGGNKNGNPSLGTTVPNKNANGDIINSPILSWVGEDGPEAIIPLGSKRRGRGLSLWERAGEILGIHKYADGGLSDNAGVTWANKVLSENGEDQSYESARSFCYKEKEAKSDQPCGISVSVSAAPVFQISGSDDEEHLVKVIRRNIKEMADDLGGEIAGTLKKVFSNMPVKEA